MNADDILALIDKATATLDVEEYGSVLDELLAGIQLRIEADRETMNRVTPNT